MKVSFKKYSPPTQKVGSLQHGDVFVMDGSHYIRSWDGVSVLRAALRPSVGMVPEDFIAFTDDTGMYKQEVIVIGKLTIETG